MTKYKLYLSKGHGPEPWNDVKKEFICEVNGNKELCEKLKEVFGKDAMISGGYTTAKATPRSISYHSASKFAPAEEFTYDRPLIIAERV